MSFRSLLFVPADSEKKLLKSVGSAADILILDLEDAVVDSRKALARGLAAEFITAHASALTARLFVRINPLDDPRSLGDLAAVVIPGLAGILLPKTHGVGDVLRLGHYLDALEARANVSAGTVAIIPLATETAASVLSMQGFAAQVPRLCGVTWGAEDLAAAVGALTNREADGTYAPLYALASSLCLLAAAASRVPAIETVHADFHDLVGLKAACSESRRRGFRGRLAIHPDQVAIINEAYSPAESELNHARRIVEAFAREPDAGTLSIDGSMVDKPHLTQAKQTLGLAR